MFRLLTAAPRPIPSELSDPVSDPAAPNNSVWEPLRICNVWDAPIVLELEELTDLTSSPADRPVSEQPENGALRHRKASLLKRNSSPIDLLNPPSAALEREQAIRLMRARGSFPVIGSICTMHGLTSAGYVVIGRSLDAAMKGTLNPLAAAVHIGAYAGLYAASSAAQGARTVLENHWAQGAYREFHGETLRLNAGHLDLWADDARREEMAAMLGLNAKGVIAASTAQISQLISATVGFAMSAGQLSLMLNPLIEAVALGSGVLSLAYIRAMSGAMHVRRTAVEQQTETLQMTNGQSVENLLLPNRHSRRVWMKRFYDQLGKQELAEVAQTMFEALRQAGVSFLMSAPMGLSLGYVAMTDVASAYRVLENTMPAFRLLDQFERAVQVGLGLHDVNANLGYLARSTSGRISAAWDDRLRHAAAHGDDFVISQDNNQVPFEAVRTDPEMLTQPGRWTIRAPNGTGKSTLLMALALHLAPKHDVYLLPAHSNVATQDGCPGSTGQVKTQQFEDIDANVAPTVRVILLDEWNGNLDQANTQRLSAMIARWSQRCAVIEVLNVKNVGTPA